MVSIIVAIAKNGIIGGGNNLLWHIPEDLQRFKRLTTGHPVVMGRKTYESIGRPLPNRTNVVITRNKSFKAEGIAVVHSLKQAIELFPDEEEIFIIGGGEIYNQAWNIANRLYITWIHAKYNGDTYFPDNYLKALHGVNKLLIKPEEVQFVGRAYKRRSIYYQWQVTHQESHLQEENINVPFEFVDYERVAAELPMFDVQVEIAVKHKR